MAILAWTWSELAYVGICLANLYSEEALYYATLYL